MVIQLSVDKENGGIYLIKSKSSLQICLWFISVRLFLISERKLHSAIYLTVKGELEQKDNE